MTVILRRPGPQIGVALGGVGMLLVRPWLWSFGPPAWAVAAFFAVLGLVGVAWPEVRVSRPRRVVAVVVTAIGIAALGLGHVLGARQAALPRSSVGVGLAVLAALAEEAFFRRFLYAFLVRGGEGLAVVGSAVCFALVHVGIYGVGVLPLDLAAGLVFSAQRWAAGTWLSPAATHVVANVLAFS